VDEEIHKIIVECTEKTQRLVLEHEEKIKALA
jgi:ATP-dependent Zn protease